MFAHHDPIKPEKNLTADSSDATWCAFQKGDGQAHMEISFECWKKIKLCMVHHLIFASGQ